MRPLQVCTIMKLTSLTNLSLIFVVSLTWALIELAKQPALQDKLRKELQAFGMDAGWDQLMGPQLPYLDAVVHETLRLHPPLTETTRVVYLIYFFYFGKL